MLVAAPESSCGAAAGTVDLALASGACFGAATLPAVADRACPELVEGSVRSTLASSNGGGWVWFASGMYSVAGVSSRELAKWEPILLAFSEELAIH